MLSPAIEIEGYEGIVVLSGGTDVTNGPTDAIGAIVDVHVCKYAREKFCLNTEDFLSRNDSYHFFKNIEQHLITGLTLIM